MSRGGLWFAAWKVLAVQEFELCVWCPHSTAAPVPQDLCEGHNKGDDETVTGFWQVSGSTSLRALQLPYWHWEGMISKERHHSSQDKTPPSPHQTWVPEGGMEELDGRNESPLCGSWTPPGPTWRLSQLPPCLPPERTVLFPQIVKHGICDLGLAPTLTSLLRDASFLFATWVSWLPEHSRLGSHTKQQQVQNQER